MKFIFKIVILFFGFNSILSAQTYQERFNTLDVQHYKLQLELNDTTNIIKATMDVLIKFKKSVTSFDLDLVTKDSTEMGM